MLRRDHPEIVNALRAFRVDYQISTSLTTVVERAESSKPGARTRPATVLGDRAYGSMPHRIELRRHRVLSLIARRNFGHGSGLGRLRWVVEKTIAWLHRFRRLRVRYDRRDDIHEGFLTLGCAMVCWKILTRTFC